MALQCEPFVLNRRRFWTTQPDACGRQEPCDSANFDCGRPGLSLTPLCEEDVCPQPCGGASNLGSLDCIDPNKPDCTEIGRSIATNDWVRSLAINMLMTDARRMDTRCGHRPGTMNGHWSESFIEGGEYIGSRIRYISSTASIREAVQLIKAEVISTMHKLVTYNVAIEINVEAFYAGNGIITVNIDILGPGDDRTKVGISAQRGSASWAWVN